MKLKRLLPLAVGLAVLTVFIAAAFFPHLFTPYGQKEMFKAWLPSTAEHPLGTNSLGYDIYTELIYGTQETLLIGITSSATALALGAVIGALSTLKGFAGALFNGLINVFVLLPKLITLIVLASFAGGSVKDLIILIAAFSWVGAARSIRSKVIHLNAQPFIENCVIQGYSKAHIILRHILPNLYDVLMARFLLSINSCIMMESTLSFLGFGDLYHPTWGTMINLRSVVVCSAESSHMRLWFVRCSAHALEVESVSGVRFMGRSLEGSLQRVPLLLGRKGLSASVQQTLMGRVQKKS